MDTRMRDVLIAGIFTIIGAFISSGILLFLPINVPPSTIDFYPDLLSPQPRDTSITWTADARDRDNDTIYYKFQLRGPSTENKWKDQQDWSQKELWIWHTKPDDVGNNTLRVLVKDNKNGRSSMGDAHQIYPFEYIITKSSLDWQNEANDLSIKGNRFEAIQAYKEALRLAPKNATTLNNLGLDLYDQKMNDEALKAYDIALEINKTDPQVWKNKGDALNRQRNYDEALKAYDEAIRLDPKYAAAWYGKGNVLKMLGHTTEFEVAIAKANGLEAANQRVALNASIALLEKMPS